MIFNVRASFTIAVVFAGVGEKMLDWLQSSGGAGCYGVMLVAFLVGSVGFPLPEEAVLAVGGYLAAKGAMSLLGAYLFGYTIVLAIDCMLYEVGRRVGPAVERSRVGRKLSRARIVGARVWFRRYGVMTVVIARFVMGTRIPVFLLAGALGVTRRKYYTAVALSGLVSNAVPVLLGYYLADQIDELVSGIDAVHGWFGIASLVLLVVLIILWRRWRPPTPAVEPGSGEG